MRIEKQTITSLKRFCISFGLSVRPPVSYILVMICDRIWIWILFCLLFVMCEIVLLLFAICQHYNDNDFSDGSDFNIMLQFNVTIQNLFLGALWVFLVITIVNLLAIT